MKLALVKSADMADWYTIERAEHGNTHSLGMHPTIGCMMLLYSGRFSDCDVEGSADEMIAIAKGIISREGCSEARRCAVRIEGDRVCFWSPRNSQIDGECTIAEADELADAIVAALGSEVSDG